MIVRGQLNNSTARIGILRNREKNSERYICAKISQLNPCSKESHAAHEVVSTSEVVRIEARRTASYRSR